MPVVKHHIFLITVFVLTINSFAQVDFSKYFKIEVKFLSAVKHGRKVPNFWIGTEDKMNDSISKFIARHPKRFLFVLMRETDSLRAYAHLFPDTFKMNAAFREGLMADTLINSSLDILMNLDGGEPAVSFSEKEMMATASRFFGFFRVKKINGNGMLAPLQNPARNGKTKYQTVLEAFCYEAMTSYNDPKEQKKYSKHFKKYFSELIRIYNLNYNSPASQIDFATNRLRELMAQDKSLKKFMKDYYEQNRDNVKFKIEYNPNF
jgi:hypothetical protein